MIMTFQTPDANASYSSPIPPGGLNRQNLNETNSGTQNSPEILSQNNSKFYEDGGMMSRISGFQDTNSTMGSLNESNMVQLPSNMHNNTSGLRFSPQDLSLPRPPNSSNNSSRRPIPNIAPNFSAGIMSSQRISIQCVNCGHPNHFQLQPVQFTD